MNAVVPPTESSAEIHSIIGVEHVGGYVLRIKFSDGMMNAVDFEPFLRRSRHPAIRAYLDLDRFRQFVLEEGFLHWNDFDLVFPMADLRAGIIS